MCAGKGLSVLGLATLERLPPIATDASFNLVCDEITDPPALPPNATNDSYILECEALPPVAVDDSFNLSCLPNAVDDSFTLECEPIIITIT